MKNIGQGNKRGKKKDRKKDPKMQNAQWRALRKKKPSHLRPKPITNSTKQVMQGDGQKKLGRRTASLEEASPPTTVTRKAPKL
jgi:hypothetical protein